jgi:hypothetical protein
LHFVVQQHALQRSGSHVHLIQTAPSSLATSPKLFPPRKSFKNI